MAITAPPSTDSNGDGRPDARGYLKLALWALTLAAAVTAYALSHLPADAPPAPPAAPVAAPSDTDAPQPAPADTDAPKAAQAAAGGAS